MKKGFFGILKGILYLLLYFVAANAIAFIYGFFKTVKEIGLYTSKRAAAGELITDEGIREKTQEITDQLLAETAPLTVIGSLLALLVFVLIIVIRKRSVKEELYLNRFSLKSVLPIVMIGAGSNIVVTYIIELLQVPNTVMEKYEETFSKAAEGSPVMFLIMTVLCAPIMEEVVFRGHVYTRMKTGISTVAAMILSGFLFGLSHGFLIQIIYAGLLGILLAYVFEKTQSLYASILLHFVFNGTSMLLSIIFGESDTVEGYVLPIAAFVVALVGVVWFIKLPSEPKTVFLHRKTVSENEACGQVSDVSTPYEGEDSFWGPVNTSSSAPVFQKRDKEFDESFTGDVTKQEEKIVESPDEQGNSRKTATDSGERDAFS